MGRKKKRQPANEQSRQPKRGMRRSIRFSEEDKPGNPPRGRGEDAPPEILLRMLTVAEALERLEFQLRAYAAKNQPKVLVVHGKGHSSPGGISILGPEVRDWCDSHPSLVESWQEAPSRWGGSGAIVITLCR
ncbi:MAG: DNA-nicking Smr family endonuclease [Candidatus Krumholzibacteriia bacterium]|jgi:DNA-nicking Smr family endonuclease